MWRTRIEQWWNCTCLGGWSGNGTKECFHYDLCHGVSCGQHGTLAAVAASAAMYRAGTAPAPAATRVSAVSFDACHGVSCGQLPHQTGGCSDGLCVCGGGYSCRARLILQERIPVLPPQECAVPGADCGVQLAPLPAGYAEAYTISDCSNPVTCGVFRRVAGAACHTRPGLTGYGHPCGHDGSCGGAPSYQRTDSLRGGAAGPALYRTYSGCGLS